MKLLDLFCGAGGSAMGYYQAGFSEIVGVDIVPQKHYPFEFIQGDALEFIHRHAHKFDAIHASPPCQAYSVTKSLHNNTHPDLIETTRNLLIMSGKPYIIENVPGAPLINPLMLCGTMFRLRVIRHRLFECNPAIWLSPFSCNHQLCYTRDKRKKHYGKLDEMKSLVQVTGGGNCSVKAAKDAMSIDWMTKKELNQAIPPAYTKWLGQEIIKQL